MLCYLRQAVLHQSKEAVDVLLENNGFGGLVTLNGDNLTPIALAARCFFCSLHLGFVGIKIASHARLLVLNFPHAHLEKWPPKAC